MHAAIGPDGAIPGERVAVLGERRVYLELESVPVVWMDSVPERPLRTPERPGREAKICFRFGRPGVHVVHQVHVPGAHTRRLQRQPIALFARSQRCLRLLSSHEFFFSGQPRSASADALLKCIPHARALGDLNPGETVLSYPRFELGCHHRRAEEVALGNITAKARQDIPGGAVFHTFGDHPQLQGVGQIDYCPHNRSGAGVGGHGLYEGLIDFQLVDRQVLQRGQRRVARAKVVDRHRHAQSAELSQVLAGAQWVGHQAALGYFEDE